MSKRDQKLKSSFELLTVLEVSSDYAWSMLIKVISLFDKGQ